MPTYIHIEPARVTVTTTGTDGSEKARAYDLALTADQANNQLHEYNLPEAASLHPATALKELFPGLQLRQRTEVQTQHPAEFIKQYRPQPQPGDELIIASPGEEYRLLQTLAEDGLLKTFTRIRLLAHEEPLYENARPAGQILDWLQTLGFELKDTPAEDPDWPVWELGRNPLQDKVDEQAQMIEQLRQKVLKAEQSQSEAQKRQKALEAELDQLRSAVAAQKDQQTNAESALQEKQQKLEQSEQGRKQAEDAVARQREVARKANDDNQRLQQRLGELEASLAASQNKLAASTQALDEHRALLQNHKERVAALGLESAGQKTRIEQLRSENAHLKSQLEAVQEDKRQLLAAQASGGETLGRLEQRLEQLATQVAESTNQKKLEDRIEYLFGQNTLQLEQATNALGSHISHTAQSTTRELEAGLALQQQLGPDASALIDSALPKNAALQLNRKLQTMPYDLVIEIGSSDIASFIAQALKKAIPGARPAITDASDQTRYVAASEDDVPQRIWSLEHNRSRYNERAAQLKESGLANYINLQFAPLVPYSHQGGEYLFYDCTSRLQHLARLMEGRQANILVVLSQAPQGNGPVADITAALPALLQYLAAHRLEVIANLPDHQGLADSWKRLLEARGLEHSGPQTFGTDPVQVITVNP